MIHESEIMDHARAFSILMKSGRTLSRWFHAITESPNEPVWLGIALAASGAPSRHQASLHFSDCCCERKSSPACYRNVARVDGPLGWIMCTGWMNHGCSCCISASVPVAVRYRRLRGGGHGRRQCSDGGCPGFGRGPVRLLQPSGRRPGDQTDCRGAFLNGARRLASARDPQGAPNTRAKIVSTCLVW